MRTIAFIPIAARGIPSKASYFRAVTQRRPCSHPRNMSNSSRSNPTPSSASASASASASGSGSGSSAGPSSIPQKAVPGYPGVTNGSYPPGTLGAAKFTDHFVSNLPGDKLLDNNQRQVFDAAYTFVLPTPASEDDMTGAWEAAKREGLVREAPPKIEKALAAWSPDAAKLLNIDGLTKNNEVEIDVLGGSGRLLDGMRPYAACYGGHQFGVWANQLGDGRAITLGECNGIDVQLKGAGKTPYSRKADGRAVMRSSIREYLCSEAMHFAGIPSTRALALVNTGCSVVRDMFYAGEPRLEPAAVVTRLAPTFLRLGNFQLPAARDEVELLRALADYAIQYHFPDVKAGDYKAFAAEVVRRNAIMVARWQGIGFVHGVMNTDNFSILGLTIDYGPYGFLDEYDPDYTPNTTDFRSKRYTYIEQPQVAHWNMLQFVQALLPISTIEDMQEVVNTFRTIYDSEYRRVFAKKLGLANMGDSDFELLQGLLKLMREHKADWTNTWRALINVRADADAAQAVNSVLVPTVLIGKNVNEEKWTVWMQAYLERIRKDSLSPQERVNAMRNANPVYILRNYMAQKAIDRAERGDFDEINRLYWLLTKPYVEQPGMERYAQLPPDWAQRRGVKVNSCSS